MHESLTLSSFVEAYQTKPAELFLLENARPVLLHHIRQDAQASESFQTQMLGAPLPQMKYAAPMSPEIVVLPLIKPEGAIYSDRIIVGRTRNCDIYLPFATISKFHAYFTWPEGPEGPFRLKDAGSTNGTIVDSEPVAVDSPVAISDGAHILFGEEIFSFLVPATFLEAVARIADMG